MPTDPRWADLASVSLEEILTDHAFCEQKAASTCISLIVNYSEYEEMVEKVTPIVAEEWGHFRKVHKELKKRGFKLGINRNDTYVNQLRQFKTKGNTQIVRFIDDLLICAIIEARSCERFRLLSLHISDENLRQFYHEFMVAEAGHYTLFIELAKSYYNPEYVKSRWQQLLDFEAEIMASLEYRGDRVH